MKLGTKLKLLRVANEKTQWDMQELAGLAPNRVSNHETGTHEPTLPVLRRYAKAYGLTLSQLLEGVD